MLTLVHAIYLIISYFWFVSNEKNLGLRVLEKFGFRKLFCMDYLGALMALCN